MESVHKFNFFNFVCIVIILLENNNLQFSSVEAYVNQMPPEAKLYRNSKKTGKSVSYLDDTLNWGDFDYLGMRAPSLLCVNGTWVAYKTAEFDVTSPKQVKIVSGINNCIAADTLESAQPVGTASHILTPSITFFKYPFFGSAAFPTAESRGLNFMAAVGAVKSIITTGKTAWSLKSKSGVWYCLHPVFDPIFVFPICQIPDISQSDFDEGSYTFTDVTKGCSHISTNHTLNITDCQTFGPRNIPPEVTPAPHGNSSTTEDFNAALNSPIQSCDNNAEFLHLLRIRFFHDFLQNEQMLWPVNKAYAWRTQLLDNSFDVVMDSCPDHVVSAEYLAVIRELYIYLAEQLIWAKEKDEQEKPNAVYKQLVYQTDKCLHNLRDSTTKLYNQVSWNYLKIKDGVFSNDVLNPLFKLRSSNDIVLETVWLVINHVAALCHHLSDYKTNFFTDYLDVFSTEYLIPMTNQWLKPGIMQNRYAVLLGGYDNSREYSRLAACTTQISKHVHHFDPFRRPMDAVY